MTLAARMLEFFGKSPMLGYIVISSMRAQHAGNNCVQINTF